MWRFLLAATLCFGNAALAEGFRGVPWGTSRAEAEKLADCATPFGEDADGFTCLDTLIGNRFGAIYGFDEDELTAGTYLMSDSPTNTNVYFGFYRQLKELLSEKYGEPATASEPDAEGIYEENPETALAMGHMLWEANWETEETTVQLALVGYGLKAQLMVFYKARATIERVEKNRRKEDLDKM